MILYKSTRGQDPKSYTFSEAILKGIAADGGLLVPETIPHISAAQLQDLSHKSYQEIAAFVFASFSLDLPTEVLQQIINTAYGENFSTKDIAPIVPLKHHQYILELWHGPTCAFKDMALQIMPLFFVEAAKKMNADRIAQGELPLKYIILVSTSGDTGKAALEGYKDKDNISIMALYPDKRVAFLQERQMSTQEGENVSVFAVDGDFDTVQDIAKQIFNDTSFNHKLFQQYHTVLSSANSINWGRLIPQVVYYVSGYLALVKNGVIRLGDSIDIAVPSGNFGNILAAFYAKKMGVPIRKLICAVNENHVLADFLQTGTYDISNRSLVKTPSPSMDILIASNIERLLFLLTNNGEKVAQWMQSLKEHKKFTVDESTKASLQRYFYAQWVTNDESLANIKRIFDKNNYLLDPHTSVAQVATERYAETAEDSTPILICATAHWSKFAQDIYAALNPAAPKKDLDDFKILEEISKLNRTLTVPRNIALLKDKPVLHTGKLPASTQAVEDEVLKWVEKKG